MFKHTKKITLSLALIVTFAFTTMPFAKANTANKEKFEDLRIEDFKNFEDIPKELLDPSFYTKDEIIQIPQQYFNPTHPETIETKFINTNSGKGEVQTKALAAAGIYLIPGIGQVALTATGAVVIGGITIAAGSWLYNQISYYFSKKAADAAAKKIPKKLKKTEGRVDLSKFKDKNGKTPENKSSGTFRNGKWTITKDLGKHIGYNGNPKAWKIGNPTRKASLDKYGNIIDE